eukprot:TRINITY_DN1730_c0_g1_i1.p1 TRINITY_DN1730_c0_g1~~TRINITY_DN1730_c0_g1_i1.p1  ORF type:complete len:1314 (+),score=159.08 TRINITY_DN1730_c0_g1_i1:105-3944(+)
MSVSKLLAAGFACLAGSHATSSRGACRGGTCSPVEREERDCGEDCHVSLLQGKVNAGNWPWLHRKEEGRKLEATAKSATEGRQEPGPLAPCEPQGAWPDPPSHPLEYNGITWPELCYEGKNTHFFLFGDYGGVTCGWMNRTLKDPNEWTCKKKKEPGFWARPADNTKDHDDRGRFHFKNVDDKAQVLVAKQMQMHAEKVRPKYILSGGDNFYFGGLDGWGVQCCSTPMNQIHPRTMVQFQYVFEEMYDGDALNIPFFSVFGNHDFGGREMTAAWDQQIAYTWAEGPTVSKRWIMPGFYWRQKIRYPDQNFTMDVFMVDTNLGDAKPFGVDTAHNICGGFNKGSATCASCGGMENRYQCQHWFLDLWKTQAKWLEKGLNESVADWQLIVTHFPPDQFGPRYWKELHRVYGIDLFVGSHRHSQEVHIRDKRFSNLNWVVCGGGGGITSEWNPDNSWRGRSQYGFMDVVINKTHLHVSSYNEAGEMRQQATIEPRPAQGELSCKHYGCGATLEWQGCMCNKDCWKHGNCCKDFAVSCPELSSCKDYGCNGRFNQRLPCQCTIDCQERGNCCQDYATKCNPSCNNYGCSSEYQKWQSCQCSDDCWRFGTCCPDYSKVCPDLARCEVWGCNSRFDKKKPCQCTADCADNGNCCEDHAVKCNATCTHYGCRTPPTNWFACQCDEECWKHGTCCTDYGPVCPYLAQCKVWGCNTRYDQKKPCQCSEDCQEKGNCCPDYGARCTPTCTVYGCGSKIQGWQACQCDADCPSRGDCCPDYHTVCPHLARCEVWGCNSKYDAKKPCQCTADCAEKDNCCVDHAVKCNATCAHYGCGITTEHWHACRCDSDCWKHGECCSDYAQTCPQLAKCQVWGCNIRYDANKPCQCTKDCAEKGNCCPDYAERCQPTCSNYGCGSDRASWKACQCDSECHARGDCCGDFAETCPMLARCELWGCHGHFDSKKPCQCTKDCASSSSCCPDYETKCHLSCENYGCGAHQESWRSCQCDEGCSDRGDCCPDFSKICPEMAACEHWGCNTRFNVKRPCQCTEYCLKQGNCCADYSTKCDPTCVNYGCKSEVEKWKACQCDKNCYVRGDCCKDFSTTCKGMARCDTFGCNARYDNKKPCQCTKDCATRGNCCEDFAESCKQSCSKYGCGKDEDWQACSCGADCWKNNNCCPDFAQECKEMASCEKLGCASRYDRRRPCQCMKQCAEYGNCCSDFEKVCTDEKQEVSERACNKDCTTKVGTYTCRARVDYLMKTERKSLASAIVEVNKVCTGQCHCDKVYYATR